jgi:hypothetical protein
MTSSMSVCPRRCIRHSREDAFAPRHPCTRIPEHLDAVLLPRAARARILFFHRLGFLPFTAHLRSPFLIHLLPAPLPYRAPEHLGPCVPTGMVIA